MITASTGFRLYAQLKLNWCLQFAKIKKKKHANDLYKQNSTYSAHTVFRLCQPLKRLRKCFTSFKVLEHVRRKKTKLSILE